jgi:hypothetical protein
MPLLRSLHYLFGKIYRYVAPDGTSLYLRTRFRFTFVKLQRMFRVLTTDARIPTASTPSIEANGSDLLAIYILLLHVGRRCAFRAGNPNQ